MERSSSPTVAPGACCGAQPDHQRAAAIFKALGHPTRTLVVAALRERERCVQDLAERAACDISTMSAHLAVLRHAGVLESRKRGAQVFHSVARPCVLQFLDCLEGT
jgi:DNA-binding transcriptional ArsR family regulator